jgi:hypothetical protein
MGGRLQEMLFTCANLKEADGKKICTMYEKRTLGMAILMCSEDMKFFYPSSCLTIYPRPQDAVPPECSYQWVSIEPPPQWNENYAPSF